MALSRSQLATFLRNPEQIRAFESLFSQGATNTIDIATIAAQVAEIQSMLDGISSWLAAVEAAVPPNSVRADYVDLSTVGPAPVDAVGRLSWNSDDGTANIGLMGGSVLQIGQETMYYAKNTSGVDISNGDPVMFSGTVGASGKLTFALAVSDGSVSPEYMMGVATQDIADNDFGYVTSFGLVRGIDTTGTPYSETWADGDVLYVDPATPGAWTNVQPDAPAIHVPIAVVVNAGPGGSGSIFVRMRISQSLNTLQDVLINGGGPSAGEVAIYNATDERWENANLTAGSGISVSNGDASITIATSGASGSFVAGVKTVTVVNGVITSIV